MTNNITNNTTNNIVKNYAPYQNNILYHGSSYNTEILEPRSSKIIDDEKAVFATNSKDLAVVFIPKWNDCDLDLGYRNDILYCCEQYPDAFNKLKNVSGFVYTINGDDFTSDPRLGMKYHEFISKKGIDKVNVLSTEKIDDVYEYLIESTMCMITFEEKLDALEQTGLIRIKE